MPDVIAGVIHFEHEAMLQWLGGSYGSEAFSAPDVKFDDPKIRWRQASLAAVRTLGTRVEREKGATPSGRLRRINCLAEDQPCADFSPLPRAVAQPESICDFLVRPRMRDHSLRRHMRSSPKSASDASCG